MHEEISVTDASWQLTEYLKTTSTLSNMKSNQRALYTVLLDLFSLNISNMNFFPLMINTNDYPFGHNNADT